MKVNLVESSVTKEMIVDKEKELMDTKSFKLCKHYDTLLLFILFFFMAQLLELAEPHKLVKVLCIGIGVSVVGFIIVTGKYKPKILQELDKLYDIKKLIELQNDLSQLQYLNITGHMIYGIDKNDNVEEHAVSEDILSKYLKDDIIHFDLITKDMIDA